MSIEKFGVTPTTIKEHFFPSRSAFSTTTSPTEESVFEMVYAAAAELTGKLSAAGVTASSLTVISTPAAYSWCADYVRLASAIRVMEAIAGAGAVPVFWRQELKDKRDDLREQGALALGDASVPSDGGGAGPRDHISTHSIDTGSTADISDAIARFRRDDEL